ncbi:hypothetical protein WDU94_006157 [Cyamophila willieti]
MVIYWKKCVRSKVLKCCESKTFKIKMSYNDIMFSKIQKYMGPPWLSAYHTSLVRGGPRDQIPSGVHSAS